MTTEEKLQIIERVLGAEPDTLTKDTALDTLPQWDSLSALNLQIELTVYKPEISFNALHSCKTIGDVCGLI